MECFIENLACPGNGYLLFLIPFLVVWLFLCLNAQVLVVVSYWLLFKKADKPGWACLIPVYNTLVMLQVVGKPWWWILLLFIPLVNIVFTIWMYNLLSKSFGKRADFTVGLLLLPWIFLPILGLGKSTYTGPAGK
ncbi:MAG: DUF5684 domain-containing protein [Bacteroidales bacterium]|nr:DUF5684 domain-containing protein [Bacteroidales bacterium]HKM30713.1 DUF5684 domain-containing protein [Bacteroidales bacterium]